jgi:hypothetical protein
LIDDNLTVDIHIRKSNKSITGTKGKKSSDLVEAGIEGSPCFSDAILPNLLLHVLHPGQVPLLLVRLLQVARILSPELLVQRTGNQASAQCSERIRELTILARAKNLVQFLKAYR